MRIRHESLPWSVLLCLPFWPIERLRRHASTLPADGPLVTGGHDERRMAIAAARPVALALELAAWCQRPSPLTVASL